MSIQKMALVDLAVRLIKAGYSDTTFSDFEYYPQMEKDFPEVSILTAEEEEFVIAEMESRIGF